MNQIIKLVTLMLVGSSVLVFAEGAQNANQPCKKIRNACLAAGFVKGGHKQGKGLSIDCVKPILAGQAVLGVTVDPQDVAACQAKKASKK